MKRNFVSLFCLSAALLWVSACNANSATPTTPTAIATVAATATSAPATATPAPAATATVAVTATTATTATNAASAASVSDVPISDEDAVTQIAATVAASLGITATGTEITGTEAMGIEGVQVLKLTGAENSPVYWLAYTIGMRSFDPEQDHLLVIYRRQGDGWQEVVRQPLSATTEASSDVPAPDYLGDGSVTQVQVEPENIWIQVEGGVGAHSGVYGLFRFDGVTLHPEASSFSASPGAGRLQDLNDDGVQEILLDASDPYVFCYACGVRLVQYNLLRWDGTQIVPVNLEPLPATAPADLQERNNQLITLAQAGLWQEALANLDATEVTPTDEPIFIWNALYIRLNAEAKRDLIGSEYDQFPLLSHVFYGDFAGAVDLMRDFTVDDLFRPDSPLILGTVAEGQEAVLADWIISSVTPALQAQPDLAAAYFLRGWANYLKDTASPAALDDLKQAATLAPDETLYTESAAYVAEGSAQSIDPQAAEVAAVLAASLGISSTEAITIGLEGVYAFKLDTGDGGQPLWLAHTVGLQRFNPEQNHVLAIYTPGADGWQEVDRLVLEHGGSPENPDASPDYLDEGSVEQVKVEPQHLWLALNGGAGAHSGVFGLFSFDGTALKLEASAFSPSPGAGQLQDVDGDGLQEVVLDTSDPYVFCYACGVRFVQYSILRWDGTQMTPVTLTLLPESAEADLRELNNEAVELAASGLWKDALATIEAASTLKANDPIFVWNAILIRMNAEAKRDNIQNNVYPLLANLFYGDFAATVDLMRTYEPDALFSLTSPLIQGTAAENWTEAVAERIVQAVEPALEVQPDLAPAYFLRGWATYLQTEDKAAALGDVQHAAQLAPEDELFTASAEYLNK